MADTLADRMRGRMKELGVKALPLADAAGVGRWFVYDILRGKSAEPSGEKLARVAAVLDVSLEYLIYGDDQKDRPIVATVPSRDYVSVPFIKVEASMGGGAVIEDEMAGEPWLFTRTWLRDVLRRRAAGLKLIRVRGDSMEPTLLGGDIVMLDTEETAPRSTGIFVLYDGCGLVGKRLEHIPNSDPPAVRVISDNMRYKPYERLAAEIRIIGRIVWFGRQLTHN